MDCLLNTVDVLMGSETRVSGKLYLNDFPGFEIKQAEYLVTADHADSLEFLNACKRESALAVIEDINSFLNERARSFSVLSNHIAGKFDENLKEKAIVAGKYGGLQIAVPSYPYLSLYTSRVSWFTKNSVTTNILVVDLQTGQTIDTLPITTVGGEITTITVEKSYQNKGQFLNLAFLVDTSLTPTYNTITNGCTSCFYRREAISRYSEGRGISINQTDTKIESKVKGEGHSFGLSVTYSLQCDPEYFICDMANKFKLAMKNRWWVEVNKNILKSKRISSLNTIHKEQAEANVAEYTAEYEKNMRNVLENMTLPNNLCYKCNPLVSMNSKF